MNKKKFRRILYFAAAVELFIWSVIFLSPQESNTTILLIFMAITSLTFVLVSITFRDVVDESVTNASKYYYLVNKHRVDGTDETLHDYDEVITKYFSDIRGEAQLLDILYNRFVMTEEALSEGNLDFLKDHCIDSLYDNLTSEYNSYASKDEKHILDHFVLHAYNVQNITLENQTISIKMSLHVSNRDYVTNKSNRIIKGSDKKNKHTQYILEFVIDKDKQFVCPNCGAHVSTKECEYCNTVFKDVYYDFTLAKIGLLENQESM